jgi:hypothetical protein
MQVLAVEPAGPQVAWPDEVRPPPEALAAPLESQLEQWTLQASLRRVQPFRGAQLAQAPEASLLVSLVLPECALPEAAEQGALSVLAPVEQAQPQV